MTQQKKRRQSREPRAFPAHIEPPGRPFIQSYGDGHFRIADAVYEGSVLVFGSTPQPPQPWAVTDPATISLRSLNPLFDPHSPASAANGPASAANGIVVMGCGATFLPPPPGLRAALRDKGLVLEWMDTGAACRTFNVLLGEDRAAVAALIAFD